MKSFLSIICAPFRWISNKFKQTIIKMALQFDQQNQLANAGGSSTWGNIGGTLSNQTDLQTALNGKQASLNSSNLKTVGGNTLLGSGDVAFKTVNGTSVVGAGSITVQPTLVSGSNIRTVNGQSLLGNTDLVISGGGSSALQSNRITSNGVLPISVVNFITGGNSFNIIENAGDGQRAWTMFVFNATYGNIWVSNGYSTRMMEPRSLYMVIGNPTNEHCEFVRIDSTGGSGPSS